MSLESASIGDLMKEIYSIIEEFKTKNKLIEDKQLELYALNESKVNLNYRFDILKKEIGRRGITSLGAAKTFLEKGYIQESFVGIFDKSMITRENK